MCFMCDLRYVLDGFNWTLLNWIELKLMMQYMGNNMCANIAILHMQTSVHNPLIIITYR